MLDRPLPHPNQEESKENSVAFRYERTEEIGASEEDMTEFATYLRSI